MIKARPTTYRGIDMRSRLEARVAQHMDGGGTLWTYEPRAFAGLGGQYLPDFEITGLDHWPDFGFHLPIYLEVKPTEAMALAALPRMEVIRESRLCNLAVAFPDANDRLVFAVDCSCSFCGCIGSGPYVPNQQWQPSTQRLWKTHHCTGVERHPHPTCMATMHQSQKPSCGHRWDGYAIGSNQKVRCLCGQKLD